MNKYEVWYGDTDDEKIHDFVVVMRNLGEIEEFSRVSFRGTYKEARSKWNDLAESLKHARRGNILSYGGHIFSNGIFRIMERQGVGPYWATSAPRQGYWPELLPEEKTANG
jgi:hypothetical protein